MKKFALADHQRLVELHNTEDEANKRAVCLLNSIRSNPLIEDKGLKIKRSENGFSLTNGSNTVSFCTIIPVDLTADEWIDKKREIDQHNKKVFERQERIIEELTTLYNALKKGMEEE